MKTKFCSAIFATLIAAATFAQAQGNTDSTTVFGVKRSDMAPQLTGDAGNVVKLVQAGVDESVVLAYVQNSRLAYHPSADELVRLHDAGVSPKIISAMMQHGNDVAQEAAKAQATTVIAQPTPAPIPAQTTYSEPVETTASPTIVYFGSETPTYPVTYFSYGGWPYTHYYYHDPYCYPTYGNVGFNWGFGSRFVSTPYYRGGFSFRGGAHFGGREGGGHFSGGHFGGSVGGGRGGGAHFGHR